MKTLVLATQNAYKVKEIAKIFADEGLTDWQVLSLDDIGFTGDIVEDGSTFMENALIKARFVKSKDYVVAADDSGIAVDALGGAPGIYSARYSGGHGNDDENNAKLLRELAGVPTEKRTARYVCALACILPSGEEWVTEKTCEGRIGEGLVGNGGFGYDPLFFPEGFDKTFGEVPPEAKHAISHRGKAVRALAAFLLEKEKEYVE